MEDDTYGMISIYHESSLVLTHWFCWSNNRFSHNHDILQQRLKSNELRENLLNSKFPTVTKAVKDISIIWGSYLLFYFLIVMKETIKI